MLVSRSATCHFLWSLYVRFEGKRCFFVHNLFKGKSSPISFTLWCTFSFEELMYVRSAFDLNIYILIWRDWYNAQHYIDTRDVEPEPAFFDPTGAGAVKLLRLRLRSRSRLRLQSKLKKSFFNCREYLFGKYVECKLCKNYVERIKTLATSGLKGPQVTHAWSSLVKKQGTVSINF